MTSRSTVALATIALALIVPGIATARPAAASRTTVKVTARDFSFQLSKHSVRHGRVTFVVKNAGQTAHDFAIAGRHTKTIGPGKTTRLTVMLRRRRDSCAPQRGYL